MSIKKKIFIGLGIFLGLFILNGLLTRTTCVSQIDPIDGMGSMSCSKNKLRDWEASIGYWYMRTIVIPYHMNHPKS